MISKPSQSLPNQLIEHRESLFAYLVCLVRDWDTAEELFQEVSLTILKKAEQGIVVEHFKAWSREIAHRTVLEHWRKTARAHLLLPDAALEALSNAYLHNSAYPGTQIERLRRLINCVNTLPAEQKRIIDLRYSADLPVKEIAALLKKSIGAIQIALTRIRTRLRICMKGIYES